MHRELRVKTSWGILVYSWLDPGNQKRVRKSKVNNRNQSVQIPLLQSTPSFNFGYGYRLTENNRKMLLSVHLTSPPYHLLSFSTTRPYFNRAHAVIWKVSHHLFCSEYILHDKAYTPIFFSHRFFVHFVESIGQVESKKRNPKKCSPLRFNGLMKSISQY